MRQKKGTVVTGRQVGLFGNELVEQRHAEAFDRAEDIRTRAWREGAQIIRTLTGKSEGQARTMVHRLLRDARDDCALLLACLQEALDLRPIEPIAWLVKAIRSRASDRAAVERIAGDWDLVAPEDLDANAARLMQRESSGEPAHRASQRVPEPLALEFANRWGD
ncbi:MAG TPA: hypothetical protein VL614_15255 [Acetobacteraceae bacterium]|jgi:hypothetical protein|nr:hypothetical protein [Acetobacteraceae bacterium]